MNSMLCPVAQISWSPELELVAAQGACQAVLARPPEALLGCPLHEAFGVSPERARTLDQRAQGSAPEVEFVSSSLREPRVVLRLALGRLEGRPTAGVVDLSTLLVNAPPVQISGLSSSLSHEIRNPLSSVKMAVQTVALSAGLSDRDLRRLTIANREVRTIERMLGMLSEYGRDAELSLELASPVALVEEAGSLLALELGERKIKLRIDDRGELARVWVDPARMRPVLAQLFVNVAMGLEDAAELVVVLTRTPEGCALSVTDPTASLPAEERHRIFEPFGSFLARGAGLSLAVLRRLMLLQGGNVHVEERSPAGVVFTLSFAG